MICWKWVPKTVMQNFERDHCIHLFTQSLLDNSSHSAPLVIVSPFPPPPLIFKNTQDNQRYPVEYEYLVSNTKILSSPSTSKNQSIPILEPHLHLSFAPRSNLVTIAYQERAWAPMAIAHIFVTAAILI